MIQWDEVRARISKVHATKSTTEFGMIVSIAYWAESARHAEKVLTADLAQRWKGTRDGYVLAFGQIKRANLFKKGGAA